MKRISRKEGNKTLCMAPWTHTYLSPQSERRLCCASREESQSFKQYIDTNSKASPYNPQKLEEHWNSEYMKKIRLDLLAGKEISQCEVCNNKLLNTNVYRDYFNNLFNYVEEDAIKNTAEDGTYNNLPISYDYRFSNLCNFKCRMCGGMLSSSWEAEERKNNAFNPADKPWMSEPLRTEIKNFQDGQVVKEFMEAVESKRLREVYWVGGEPLMYEIHWDSMKRMVDINLAHLVWARYNTNLSRIKWKGIDLFKDLLVHFRNWEVCASIDGTGKIGEWIRTGLKWEQWLDNFKYGRSFAQTPRQIRLDLTITTPGLFTLKEMFDLSKELNVDLLTKVTFAFTPDIVLCPLALPKHILHRIIDDILAYAEPRATWNQKAFIDVLKHLKTRKTFEEQYSKEEVERGFIKGRARQKWLEQIRPNETPIKINEIYQQDKEVHEWWTR